MAYANMWFNGISGPATGASVKTITGALMMRKKKPGTDRSQRHALEAEFQPPKRATAPMQSTRNAQMMLAVHGSSPGKRKIACAMKISSSDCN